MLDALYQLWITFVIFMGQLGTVLALAGQNLLPWLPAFAWCLWWLCCVDWTKAWPMLRQGGWVGVVLLTFAAALSWSSIFPKSCDCLGFAMPNFWWQLGACTSLALIALLCGWLQGRFGWTPAEVSFDPPAHHDDHHGHH